MSSNLPFCPRSRQFRLEDGQNASLINTVKTCNTRPVTTLNHSLNRRPVKVANMRPHFFNDCTVSMAEWSGCSSCSGAILVQIRFSAFNVWARFWMLLIPTFVWHTSRPECSFLEGVRTWSLDLTFYALPKLFLPSTSRTMILEAVFWGK